MKDKSSADSLLDATRTRADFSGHGNAKGAAGVRESSYDPDNSEHLSDPGQSIAISPGKDGFESIKIAVEWDNIKNSKRSFLDKLLGKNKGVDLDLGCLYELEDGTRGCLQAFGSDHGHLDSAPYIHLSDDERTGDADGHDEFFTIKGEHWGKIKRLLVYIYIYEGAARWSEVKPRILIDVPGEEDLYVTLGNHNDALDICAIGGLENVRGGIKLTNYTEYFHGHPAMDRAFGYGIEWEDGSKD